MKHYKIHCNKCKTYEETYGPFEQLNNNHEKEVTTLKQIESSFWFHHIFKLD